MSNHYKVPYSPLVSIIIPAYNAEKFIEKTLQSVLSQTYQNFEVIVVNDGSQDQTATIVKATAQHDRRVILLQQANAGVATARNLAIQYSRGELIAPIDADDTWFPNNLEKQVQCLLNADTTVGMIYAWSVEIDEEDQFCGGFHASDFQGGIYTKLLYNNFIGNASAVLIRRDCLTELGGYNCNLRAQGGQGCEDIELYLRIAEHNQIKVVPEFLVGYRQVKNSMSCSYTSMAKSQHLVLEAVRKRHPEIPTCVYQWSMSNFYAYLAHQASRNNHSKGTLFWLYQALCLDSTMILIRHDTYSLVLISLLNIAAEKLSIIRFIKSKLVMKNQQKQGEIVFSDLYTLVKARNFSPSQMYKNIRLNQLSSN
jgi:glycosyltransferase involved in cell wall biosynthesis